MKSVEILVSIVNWNSGNALEECVSNFYKLLLSSKRMFKILIYDNNSSDNSESFEIIDKEHIQVIKGNKNEGLKSHLYNLLNVKYKYLIVSNSDILFREGDFNKMIAFIESNDEISVMGFNILKSDGTLLRRAFHSNGFPSFTEWLIQKSLFRLIFEIILKLFKSKTPNRIVSALHQCEIPLNNTPLRVERVSGCVFITTNNTIERIGLFDPNFFMYVETIDFLMRVKNYGGHVMYYPMISFTHYGGLSNRKRSGINIQHNMSYFYYYKKHFGKAYAYLICLAIIADLSIRLILHISFRSTRLLPKHSTIESLKEDIYYWSEKLRFVNFDETPYFKNPGD